MHRVDVVVIFVDAVDVFIDNLSAGDFSAEESLVEGFYSHLS